MSLLLFLILLDVLNKALMDKQGIAQTYLAICYRGSKITTTGGSAEDIATRINKARGAFAQLNTIWFSKSISVRFRIFNYSATSTFIRSRMIRKMQYFSNSCYRKILRIC